MQTGNIKIRIEPDWNVNPVQAKSQTHFMQIRIEPDWNVNFIVGDLKEAVKIY